MIYVVLGAPGAGKGTRAKILCEKLEIPHVSTGSLIRENVEMFEKYRSELSDGKLIPDSVMKEMLISRLNKDDAKYGFVLDGYPRNFVQVQDLDEILKSKEAEIAKVFLFEVPEEEIYNKITDKTKILILI